MPRLAAPYAPRRLTETVLYGVVRQHLESFLAHARETYEAPIPRYVEDELRGYLKCGVFLRGFVRAHCDACGHDRLVAFTCKARTVCPSCAGRRMANLAAHLVDRVVPPVPVRQWVLSLPFELRALAAFRADVLSALGRIFVEAIFSRYRAWAKGQGLGDAPTGAVTHVQRFGSSLNLNVHFHVMLLDGVFVRDAQGRAIFHPAPAPTRDELEDVVRRVQRRVTAWLARKKLLASGAEDRSQDPSAQTSIDACAAIALGHGSLRTLPDDPEAEEDGVPPVPTVPRDEGAVERDGFNLHASVVIAAEDDMGRERLMRYGARPCARARAAATSAWRTACVSDQEAPQRACETQDHDAARVSRAALRPRGSAALPASPLPRCACSSFFMATRRCAATARASHEGVPRNSEERGRERRQAC